LIVHVAGDARPYRVRRTVGFDADTGRG
jgi:hypothetical protein